MLESYSNLDLMDRYKTRFLFHDLSLNQGIVKDVESNETLMLLSLANVTDFQFVGPFSDYLVVTRDDYVDFFEVVRGQNILSEEEEAEHAITTIYGASGDLKKSFFVDNKVFLFYPDKLLVWRAE